MQPKGFVFLPELGILLAITLGGKAGHGYLGNAGAYG
jgi:hypothetical protein